VNHGAGGMGQGQPAGAADSEVLRFIDDVDKWNCQAGLFQQDLHGASCTIFIGDHVRVREPGGPRATSNRLAKVVAKGSCHGKRPTLPSAFLPTAPGTCFVLVLNASGIEGLDLGEATHLIKTEPIARDDKERQAEARGRRLGACGRLQIVQMMMAGTIEEATYDELAEARRQSDNKAQAAAGTSAAGMSAAHAACKPVAGVWPCEIQPPAAGKRRRVERSAGDDKEEEEDRLGKQAAMLNKLRLLRPLEE